MDIIQALVYGIIQGIGEFLPISSTAHIVLAPWFFGWKDPGTAFDVALHLGTAVAVILFFYKDWINLLNAGLFHRKTADGKLFWLLVLATIPGGIAGVLLDKYMEDFKNPLLIGIMLIIIGFVLYVADIIGRNDIRIKEIGLSRSILVGISQALAIIPGVSRSGITMATGRFLGITRESIARFSFLLSTPIILADGLYHIKGLKNVPVDKLSFAVAVITSAVVGLLSIKFLLNYLRTKGFGIFALYRLVLGAVVIVAYFLR